MPPLNPEEKLRRANEARALVDNPLFKEACQEIERRAFEMLLAATAPIDGNAAPHLAMLAAMRIEAIRGLREHFVSVVTDGAQAVRRAPGSHV